MSNPNVLGICFPLILAISCLNIFSSISIGSSSIKKSSVYPLNFSSFSQATKYIIEPLKNSASIFPFDVTSLFNNFTGILFSRSKSSYFWASSLNVVKNTFFNCVYVKHPKNPLLPGLLTHASIAT